MNLLPCDILPCEILPCDILPCDNAMYYVKDSSKYDFYTTFFYLYLLKAHIFQQ